MKEQKQDHRNRFRSLEGRRVSLSLSDGSRIDDCELVSAGAGAVRTLWVFTGGSDVFVSRDDVIDIWEVVASPVRRAA